VEQSKEVRTGGRIDHTFVYERPDIQLGEGRYRLRLAVGGDKLTGLSHFVKVPEAFSRRYEQMCSSNGHMNSVVFVVAFTEESLETKGENTGFAPGVGFPQPAGT
jgi:hypothetical protein